MLSHGSDDTASAVQRFKNAEPGTVLVSPSMTSGYDFPNDECRFIGIGKVPFPDMRSPVMQARKEDDKDWPMHLAMQSLVQTGGRGTRNTRDWCEVLIFDDSWKWFYRKYKGFAPVWFQNRVQRSMPYLPEPPPLSGF